MSFRLLFLFLSLCFAGISAANACDPVALLEVPQWHVALRHDVPGTRLGQMIGIEHDSRQCDCPAPIVGAAAPVVESEKSRMAAACCADRLEGAPSLLFSGDSHRIRQLSAAEPPDRLPLYLQTARLRR